MENTLHWKKLESKYAGSPFIENICVHADSKHDFPVALVFLNKKTTENWAKEKGISGTFESLTENPELKKAVLSSMTEIAKKTGLKAIEFIQGVHLCHEEWTPENGLLTAAMKIKRTELVAKFKTQVEELMSTKD